MRKFLLALIMLFFIASTTTAQVRIKVGPYLQSPTPTSIKVMWRTTTATSSKVVFGESLSSLNQTVIDTALTTKHTVELKNLQPYTKYYYAIYDDNTLLAGTDAKHSFRTFPVAGSTPHIRGWVIGDFGKANEYQQKVRDSYLAFEEADTVETNLWFWLGDNAYGDGTEAEYEKNVFDTTWGYQGMMTGLPFTPTPGNHDYNSVSPIAAPKPPLQHFGPYYEFVDVYKNAEAGGVATGHELFYSFDYGNAHFISLNSELGSLFNAADDWTGVAFGGGFTTSPMTQWLHQDLQANTKPWVVVYFHQPPYTDGSHDASAFWEVFMKAMRQHFAPIWEQYGVDLVMCGHSHVYERSYVVKGAYGDVSDITLFNVLQNQSGVDSIGEAYVKYTQGQNSNEGTLYMVCGNSGSKDDNPNFQHPYMYAEYGCDTCVGSFVLDIEGNRLEGRHLDGYGNIRDHFTIYKVDGASDIESFDEKYISKLRVAPNPFSQTTKLAFDLRKADFIRVLLADMNGKIIELHKGQLGAGVHEFEIDAKKLDLPNGTYSIALSTNKQTIAKTIVKID
jgi:hypothetical protein